ncbi:unnamed protein product [Lepeophtheirus salmonis]|uniref:(salmon louse) hypothetical protein n=1 Tax=Lepeophtheirus salmonis TaxID=72036 RepID=A0A7R8D5S6_LEPSM|nr:unnamed protein product [Lepeophtheirus salmonis]CAF2982577.1 unnamed protein product [Lepeophtheirus salmonis]
MIKIVTTRGSDIFNTVTSPVSQYGGIEKLLAVVTDIKPSIQRSHMDTQAEWSKPSYNALHHPSGSPLHRDTKRKREGRIKSFLVDEGSTSRATHKTNENSQALKVLYIVCILIGLIENCIICGCIIKIMSKSCLQRKYSKHVRNLFVLLSVISDMTILLFYLPLSLWETLNGWWIFGSEYELLCKLLKFLQEYPVFLSAFAIVCVGLDRYRCIVSSVNHYGKKEFYQLVIGINVISTIACLPVLWNAKCSSVPRNRNRAKTLKLIGFVMLNFVITWAPYNVINFLFDLSACDIINLRGFGKILRDSHGFIQLLAIEHSCINPITYALYHKDIRKTLIKWTRTIKGNWTPQNTEV